MSEHSDDISHERNRVGDDVEPGNTDGQEEQVNDAVASADMRVAKIQMKRRLTSQRRGLILQIRDEVLSLDAVRDEFEAVQWFANEVNQVLESLVTCFQAEKKGKAVDAAITELEEVAEAMAHPA
eukprot:scpid66944/ scgid21140/ 